QLSSINGSISNAALNFTGYDQVNTEQYAHYELTFDGPVSGSTFTVLIKLALHLAVSNNGTGLSYGDNLGSSSIAGGSYHFITDAFFAGQTQFQVGNVDLQIKSTDIQIPVSTFYQDADGDGFGNPAQSISASSPPPGYVSD